MKRLLLTSEGITSKKIEREVIKLMPNPIETAKVLIINSMQTNEDTFYFNEVKKELTKLGVLEKNLMHIDVAKNIKTENFKNFNAIYFCGGNTYYLLDRIKKIGLDELIKDFVNCGGFYLGVSAGSIIAGKNIEIAGWGKEGDKNEIRLKDLRGLGFTNIAIFPHYKDTLKQEVEEFRSKVDYPVEALRDSEAILILGGGVKKIK